MANEGINRQRAVYLSGIAGKKPLIPLNFQELENRVAAKISKEAFAYIAGGAGYERTISENRKGFENWSIQPRVLCGVNERKTSVSLFNREIPFPMLLSPIGVLEMAHPKADMAVARAAGKHNIPFIFSNQASVAMEICATAMGNGAHWFQLYWSKNKDLVTSFVQRAEACGSSAIVLTLDTTMLGWRCRDLDLAYLPFLRGKGIAQYVSDPVFQKLLKETDEGEKTPRPKLNASTIRTLLQAVKAYPHGSFINKLLSGMPMRAVKKFIDIYSNPGITWDDLAFLRRQTKLPIVLKGILHSDDALKAIDHGMDGIIVSNHGGRQLDGAVSTIQVLPKIAEAVNKQIRILLDSGVRGGSDIFISLALGADAVCIGRPYAYALALAGEAGVDDLISNYKADFDLCMGLAGCRSLDEIGAQSVCRTQ